MNKKILIQPFPARLPHREVHPKTYAFWPDLITLLKSGDYITYQLMVKDDEKLPCDNYIVDKSLKEIKDMLNDYDILICCDSFLQHLAWYSGYKGKCVVIFSQSDSRIFGHDCNWNILKDKKYLRPDQFGVWNHCKYTPDAFEYPDTIFKYIQEVSK